MGTSQAGFPGNNGLIAFYSDKGETDGIWTVGPDGSNRTRVFQGPGAGTPDWSSNGFRIAFGIASETTASLGSGIYMMNADGSDRVRITNGPDCCPSWSPDGLKLVFQRDQQLWVVNVDGTDEHTISDGQGLDENPEWSPSGHLIAFDSYRNGNRDIYVVDPDGNNRTRLTRQEGADIEPDWSPDSGHIVYSSSKPCSECTSPLQLWLMNVDGSLKRKLLSSPTTDDTEPAWSPDGSRIAFTRSSFNNNAASGPIGADAIYVVGADGTGATVLVDGSFDNSQPDWQPLVPHPTGPHPGGGGGGGGQTSGDQPPAAALTVLPTLVKPGQTVTANASASTDTDATKIESYRFDFGDGTIVGPQGSPMATHAYTKTGSFTVTVTVADTAGLKGTASRTVSVDAAPTAVLAVKTGAGGAATANGGGSSDPDATKIVSYTFDFGDGTVVGPQPGPTASHTYAKAGTYTVKLTATDSAGLTGSDSKTVEIAAGGTPPPAPQFGQTVNVQVTDGTVLCRKTKKGKFVKVTKVTQFPVGSECNTINGTLHIVVSATQFADVSDGSFVITQLKNPPITQFTLTGDTSALQGYRVTQATPPPIRRLFTKAKGRFKTTGRYAAATLRGTAWLMSDRSDGTLTKVTQGVVSVRDLVLKKTVVVRAGQSYLAKKPKHP